MPQGSQKDDNVIIGVFGPTGTGKSTFIKCALERTGAEPAASRSLVGHRLGAHTRSVQSYACQHPDMPTKTVVFVDTPGLQVDDPTASADALSQIATYLEHSVRKGQKLAGILYFHRISDNRMGHNPIASLGMFKKLCGADALRNVIMITSMWDLVEEDVAASRESELLGNFWSSMKRGGSQHARFHRTCDSAWNIIDIVPKMAQMLATLNRTPGFPLLSIIAHLEASNAEKSVIKNAQLERYFREFFTFLPSNDSPARRSHVFRRIVRVITRYCAVQIRRLLLSFLSVKGD